VLIVDPLLGTATVLAGDGQTSTSAAYDNVPGASARFALPVALAVDSAGRVYVADSGAHVIRRIDSDPLHTTTTVAGMLGVSGDADGLASAARFSRPSGLALQSDSSTLYVADTANHRVRAVDIETGSVITTAGSTLGDADGPGVSARFSYPTGIAAAQDGRVFVLASQSRKVKVILPDASRTVVTLAGGLEGYADGSGDVARLSPQSGAAWSGTFLATSDGPSSRVRALVPGPSASATSVLTLAFSGREGRIDGPAADSRISLPVGLAVAGNAIYVTDGADGSIRKIMLVPQ